MVAAQPSHAGAGRTGQPVQDPAEGPWIAEDLHQEGDQASRLLVAAACVQTDPAAGAAQTQLAVAEARMGLVERAVDHPERNQARA